MTSMTESSAAIESPVARETVDDLNRLVRRLFVATALAVVAGLLVRPLLGLAWLAAYGLGACWAISLKKLRRLRRALTEHRWRSIDFARVGASRWWEAKDNAGRQFYALCSTMPPHLTASVAGPTQPERRRRQWSAVQTAGSDKVELVRGPRRPDPWLSRTIGAWTLAAWRLRRRPEKAGRPLSLHDVPSTPCTLDRAGLLVEPARDGVVPDMIYLLIWTRGCAPCELWPNGDRRIGHVAREGNCFGLLDNDDCLVIDREQRFGDQIFSNAAGRLAVGHRDRLTVEGTQIKSRAVRNGHALEADGGEPVASVVAIARARGETTALAAVSTTLTPITRAVVLLHACALLDLPAARPASS